ncbi:MAG: DUF4433 domain-containing protein [Cellulomonas sp.]|uniref:type II toxin-antitoxin system toxin DNA ADP-ribosyl transferase DarT n=1 Tax=Cellulomonas sp. 73-92 TaxID=1895740 RepID=UPI00092A1674|nr:DUF4433 domain-containing protein [Cellulomonas sp. 73-92]MBN9375656.1 DUF4433 domain-containing protein [Cellulomonas sp.]OJV83564.1 MAG: hypothetical protein BGO37_09975 [Cellulomonas sp. 73-92]
MPPPTPTWLYHFTHLDHLPSIVREGLIADTEVQARGLVVREAGDREIKGRRRRRAVSVGPRGTVGDYVPFYFAPRSPMLYSISHGNVLTFQGRTSDLVYLGTTVELLEDFGADLVFTDRNAVLGYTEFTADRTVWTAGGFIDWGLMRETYWNNTAEYPDRKERRMAECLVHRGVPWNAILTVGVFDAQRKDLVEQVLVGAAHVPPVHVRRSWYF